MASSDSNVGAIMGWFDSLFGGGDDGQDEASEILGKSENMLRDYYEPYRQYGNQAQPQLQQQYEMLMNNPGSKWNEWGQGFNQSPGYQFQMDQAMNGANQAAAAGGMLGTPQHSQDSMRYASELANQDYYNYMNNMQDLYGAGVSGTQRMFDTGYDATNQLAGSLGNLYGSQANMAYSQGQSKDSMLSSLLGAGFGAGGFVLGNMVAPGVGGSLGAMAGSSIGNYVGKEFEPEPYKAPPGWMGSY